MLFFVFFFLFLLALRHPCFRFDTFVPVARPASFDYGPGYEQVYMVSDAIVAGDVSTAHSVDPGENTTVTTLPPVILRSCAAHHNESKLLLLLFFFFWFCAGLVVQFQLDADGDGQPNHHRDQRAAE
jgi:hypothetical protein